MDILPYTFPFSNVTSISFWGNVFPLLCAAWAGGEIKGSYPPTIKAEEGSLLCPILLSLITLCQPRERHMADRISSRSSKTKPNDAKTKKNGKGSFIPESQIVLFLVSVPFPRPVLQPFHPYPSNLNSFFAWIK